MTSQALSPPHRVCLAVSDTDRDFDPSAEQLINDFDDERTLEEEENLSDNSCSNELDDLTKVKINDIDRITKHSHLMFTAKKQLSGYFANIKSI